jgi:hypothetical protein
MEVGEWTRRVVDIDITNMGAMVVTQEVVDTAILPRKAMATTMKVAAKHVPLACTH